MLDNTFLALANASIKISANALWTIFAFILFIYIVISSILYYHWKQYSLGNPKIIFAKSLYFVVSAVLIIGATLTLLAL